MIGGQHTSSPVLAAFVRHVDGMDESGSKEVLKELFLDHKSLDCLFWIRLQRGEWTGLYSFPLPPHDVHRLHHGRCME